MEIKMRFNPWDVIGTGISSFLAIISLSTMQQIVGLCCGLCALVAGIVTIRNGLLNGRKAVLEIKQLERNEASK